MVRRVQEIHEFIVEEEDRLDRFLARAYPDFSRSYLQRLIEEGYVFGGEPSYHETPQKG
jgi:23S rRNA pseudouridine1911/1915/1917 synthase